MHEFPLYRHLVQDIGIPSVDAMDFLNQVQLIKLKKKSFLQTNENEKDIYFIVKGLLGLVSAKDQNKVLSFYQEKDWLLLTNKETGLGKIGNTFLAIEEAELFKVSDDWIEKFSHQFPQFAIYMMRHCIKHYELTLDHVSALLTFEAEGRYQSFSDRAHTMLQRVPQYLLAYHLGILPTSLSRLRNQIRKKRLVK